MTQVQMLLDLLVFPGFLDVGYYHNFANCIRPFRMIPNFVQMNAKGVSGNFQPLIWLIPNGGMAFYVILLCDIQCPLELWEPGHVEVWNPFVCI